MLFFFNDPSTTEIYTYGHPFALHDALPILKEKGVATEIAAISVGPAKAQETLRTALAMGADRAILVQSDDAVEPLGVAKILKAIADAEQPGQIGRAHV